MSEYVIRDEERVALRGLLRQRDGIRAALLEGPPGCGKTEFARHVASELGAMLVYHLLHSWSDDQELHCGIDVAAAVSGDAERVRQPGVLAVAAEASQQGMTVLCLDEIDKVHERTENLLLDFLQTGRVPVRPGFHVQARTENLLVFLTSNAQRELSDALLRRVRRVRMRPLPAEVLDRLAAVKSGAPISVVTTLRKAAQAIAEADGCVLSLQELAYLATDVWHVAESSAEARLLLSQWAARGPKGAAAATRIDLGPAWGEVMAARRRSKR